MNTLCADTGAALLACNLAGIAQTETACGQTLDAPRRSRAVLTIDSRPAGLKIVGTDQDAIHLSAPPVMSKTPAISVSGFLEIRMTAS